ncbi:hypothetical protein [Cellulosilyticum ruminicola]|uniref:hypothetical protein n=1 Tax=Cellulosilyticum ruminicola TaxID=425254 RepID=UPI0006D11ABC|nr:hypothetical protein [Cellulosilyticum ruminicola]
MKKGTVSLLIILVCIVMSACRRVDEKQNIATLETSQEQNTADLYVGVLQNYLSEGKKVFSVAFINLNEDDIKEMVVIFGDTQMDGEYLYTIKDGKAIQVVAQNQEHFGQYGGFSYLEKGNIFITENESTTDSQITHTIAYYSMENGKAICEDEVKSVTSFDSDQPIYYINEKQATNAQYDNIAEKYSLTDMSTIKYSEAIHITDTHMEKIYKAYNNEK